MKLKNPRPGRPPGSAYPARFIIKITPEQAAKIKESGGSRWLRQLIDSANVIEKEEQNGRI